MSRLTMLQKNGITNMVCKNEDCHTPETNCPCTIIDQGECPTLKEVVETLAYYNDLEEQGRLIEQKHGRWIHKDNFIGKYLMCSECSHVTGMKGNYCPNCGAKMNEVKE